LAINLEKFECPEDKDEYKWDEMINDSLGG